MPLFIVRWLLCACILSLCLPVRAALAQDIAMADQADILETPEVVVSGTRLPDNPVDARTIPAKVTVITAEDIRKTGAKTIQEAVQWATGVVMYDLVGNSFQQTIDLRGFNGQAVPSTSVFVDGVRVNEPDFNSVNFDLIPMETVERIEILPSSSAVFGKNSLGGTLNIITKRGGETRTVSADTLYGSYNRERTTITASGPIGKFDFVSSFAREKEDGYRRESGANITRFFGKLGYRPSDTTDVSVSYTYVGDKLFQAGALTVSELAQDRRQNTSPGDFFAHENNFLRLNVRQGLPGGFTLSGNAFYRILDQDTFVNFGGGFTSPTTMHTESRGGVVQLSHEGEALGIKNSFVVGSEVTRNDFNGTAGGFSPSKATTNEDVVAWYVQDTVRITSRLSVVGGLRYDHDQFSFDETQNTRPDGNVRFSGLTPRGGASYLLTSSTSVYFNYSQGFRVPTAQEMFAFLPFTSNPGLRPARAQTYEVGIKGNISPRTEYVMAVFRTDVRNEIQFTCIVCNGSFGDGINRNLDRTRRQGVEATLKTKLTDFVGAELNYTYVQAVFRKRETFSNSNIADVGDSLPLVPNHRLSVMGHLYPATGWTVSLIGLYVSSQVSLGDEANAVERIPGYFVLNGRVAYESKVPGGRLSAYLLLNNLTDHKYSTFGTAGDGTAGPFGRTYVPAPGIAIFGGLSYRFDLSALTGGAS